MWIACTSSVPNIQMTFKVKNKIQIYVVFLSKQWVPWTCFCADPSVRWCRCWEYCVPVSVQHNSTEKPKHKAVCCNAHTKRQPRGGRRRKGSKEYRLSSPLAFATREGTLDSSKVRTNEVLQKHPSSQCCPATPLPHFWGVPQMDKNCTKRKVPWYPASQRSTNFTLLV